MYGVVMMQAGKRRGSAMEIRGLLVLVMLALFGATVLYWLGRPAGSVLFLKHLPPPPAILDGALWQSLANHVPDLVHPFVFILLTVVIAAPTVHLSVICLFWLTVDSLLEIGQLPWVAAQVAAALPAWFSQVPVLKHTGWYFLSGTFDPMDLLATAIGSLGAYLAVSCVASRCSQKTFEQHI